MSEEKKIVELNDEELEKASGGLPPLISQVPLNTIIQLVCPDCGYVFDEVYNNESEYYERLCPSCNVIVKPKTIVKQ